ncbi:MULTISPECIES: CmpA/NrtA family ABC transporter substrate-binding protein [Rhizobium/Agrobacterium group]|uniref:CmpA/NrtA family ABC transporter substrate-binding protein n=1 Tax=Rhizobium/Agrobacterium group TaxID=227290 RepID=UPI001F2B270C|nr:MULTISPECIES: CmpA/NrtA family ABC transporter substrate-binding protein [Rhizobium/Agrobacterium group]
MYAAMGQHISLHVTLGYMPCLDSAPLVAAVEKGFASDEGLTLRLVRETSWAQIRDRLTVGHFDGAHLPAPFALAANLGFSPLGPALLVPMALNLGGGAFTVSNALATAMQRAGWESHLLEPTAAGAALKRVVEERRAKSLPPLRIAVGDTHSSQAYYLRYWLAACNLDCGSEVEMVSLPSPLMADGLGAGVLDGFCAAEPWSSVAVDRQVGRIVAATAAIWRGGPDKVLGISRQWGENNPAALDALIRALYRAAQWCGNPGNTEELAGIMAAPRYLGVEGRLLLPGLTGDLVTAPGEVQPLEDFLVLERKAANFPWASHALWFYSQMVLGGHVVHARERIATVLETYRPDLYRRALRPVFAAMPGANIKVEGAMAAADYVGASNGRLLLGPDGFFDGRVFDPDRLDDYLAASLVE